MRDGEISANPDPSLPPWEWGVRQGGTMNYEVMKANALEFKEVCDKHELKFVIMFGTLLGAVRDGNPIPHDSDFDVMCYASEYRKWILVRSELRNRGFYIPEDKPLNDEYIIRGGEKIDINWIHYTGKYWFYDKDLYYPEKYFCRIEHTPLFGTMFPMPFESKQLLTDLYDDWRVPQKRKGNFAIYPK